MKCSDPLSLSLPLPPSPPPPSLSPPLPLPPSLSPFLSLSLSLPLSLILSLPPPPLSLQIAIVQFMQPVAQCPLRALILVWNDKQRQFTGLVPLEQVILVTDVLLITESPLQLHSEYY